MTFIFITDNLTIIFMTIDQQFFQHNINTEKWLSKDWGIFFFLLPYYSWPNIYHRTWERKSKIFTLGKQKLAKVLHFCIKRRIKQIFYYEIICHLAIPHIGPATGGHLSTRNISQNIRLVHQITECWATNEILQGNQIKNPN